jgi:hypothetical protein
MWTRTGGLQILARASCDPVLKNDVPVVLVHVLVVSSRNTVPTVE